LHLREEAIVSQAAEVRTSNARNWYPWSNHDHHNPAIKEFHDDRTTGERVADDVAKFGGSWRFIFLFLSVIVLWMVINTLILGRALHGDQFDPYPYIALNLVLSAMAGLQAPIIMMSQNRASARVEALASHHYAESQKMETVLENQKQLLDENTELTKQIHDLTLQIHQVLSKT
jgi:uncharacterized membrane protein